MKGEIFSRAVGFIASFSRQPSSPSSSPFSSLLQIRDATDCPNPSYVTENGLHFDTSCGIDFLFPESASTTERDMASCMEQCSFSQPPCYGVTYYTQNQTCSLKGIGINSSYASTTASDNVHVNSALANVTQMSGLDPTCPFQNNSVISTSGGMPFHIYCNQDLGGDDYLPWGVAGRAHADTMMECMEICEHAHPLCLGASWNADLSAGYANCYLKNTQGVPHTVEYISHTGLVQMPIIDSCKTSDEHQITSNDKTFNVSCYGARSGSSNATSVYSANITGCVDACADYKGPSSCLGVFYDNSFEDGFDNCYLLNDTGTSTIPRNSTYASLVSGTPSNSSSSPSSSTTPSTSATSGSSSSGGGGSSSKAWIAGPVVGGLVALAIVFAGLFFWRRRRTVGGGKAVAGEGGERGEVKAYVPIDQRDTTGSRGMHELPRYPIAEMGEPESRHELPGN